MKIPRYDPKKIELKWQKYWLKNESYRADLDTHPNAEQRRKKFYALVEFPYPSGEGLHTGHVRGYTAMDILARKRRLEGYNVLYPIGWDAFGLPTENYAIKTGIHPAIVTKQNTDTFRKQMRSLGFAFDWSREINTTDPEYYRWTQWIFLQLFKKGLAYKAKMEINWCPSCKIGLANEEVIDGTCERCGNVTEKREKEQWMLAITKYADRLDKDLDTVDYWEKIKIQQRNWIGRSEGTIVKFPIKQNASTESYPSSVEERIGEVECIEVFTTRVDTIFGCTYVVVAPEHPLVKQPSECHPALDAGSRLNFGITNSEEVKEYIVDAKKKTEQNRLDVTKEKTGVRIEGVEAINPFTGEAVPIFVADYVLGSYGTGAVMAVPAHDERDFEFAKKYELPMRISIAPFFCTIDGKDAVRDGTLTVRRRTVFVLVKHWMEDKYLCLDWEKFGWHSGIIGGIEDGEDPVTAAKREIVEETGYKNLEFVKYVGQAMHTNFYAAHKNVNRYADGVGMLFQLKNDFWEQPKEEEIVNHKAVWIDGDKMETFLNLKNFQYMWRVLIADKECFTEDGVLVNSNEFSDLKSEEARAKMITWLEEKSLGKRQVNFKLRDWVFSRQRYWGEPIPMVFCTRCAERIKNKEFGIKRECNAGEIRNPGWFAIPEEELPLKLPKVKSYTPTDTGESPLAAMKTWVKTKCPVCGGKATRETDTMPNWAGSSWYYLRYTDPKNTEALASKEALNYWTPTDWYNGGMEHTTLHLLYSRFWHKFLFDIGVVPTAEPYQKRTSHGLILAEGGVKMSKSKGNVVNPDSVIRDFGADTLRVYEMFMGPFDQHVAWSMESISGSRRFLEKVWKLQFRIKNEELSIKQNPEIQNQESRVTNQAEMQIQHQKLQTLLHQTIKKVSEDIEAMRFNTAVSSLMIFVNELEKQETISQILYSQFLILLSPFAPHITEELWQALGNKNSIFIAQWPKADEKYLVKKTVKIIVQVNGKLRASFDVPTDTNEVDVKAQAEADGRVAMYLKDKTIRKVIFVPNRLINFVIG